MQLKHLARAIVVAGLGLMLVNPAVAQDGAVWRIGKASGEVWLGKAAVQQASLGADAALVPGETVRTGRNGRVLLSRGEETIMVGPNSEVALPAEAADGMKTTILQRAGSILLEVEKKNVPHFEVVTPYLAAVVKGTQFRVSVDRRGGRVEVTHGQVQVADFKSGQHALVLPGQSANVAAFGTAGLSLSGSGTFNKIEHGQARNAPVKLVPVPKGGFKGPATRSGPEERHAAVPRSATMISAPLGEVKMNFHAATQGLARAASASPTGTKGDTKGDTKDTVWGPAEAKATDAAA